MSQIYKAAVAGPPPPISLTNITTDVANDTTTGPGTVNVVGNNIQLLGRDTSQNNINGVRTDADPNAGNIGYVELTNRVHGNAQSINVQTVNVMIFTPPAGDGVYDLTINIVAWDNANQQGAAYQMLGAVKSIGGVLTTIGTPIRTERGENPPFITTLIDVVISPPTQINIQATGLAGRTIRWTGVMTYVYGGA